MIPDDPLIPLIEAHQEMLANRLRKRARHLSRWVRRENTTAYRIYDHDIPELPLYIDRYNDYYVVSWLIPRELRDFSEQPMAHPWMQAIAQTIADTVGTDVDQLFIRSRRPTRSGEQYDRIEVREVQAIVQEHGLDFRVNLSDFVDTGLFMDHRPTRKRVREFAKDKRVLNLFGYTGAFAVHAAAGGSRETLGLDLSPHYTAWALENLERNGFETGRAHQAHAVDVLDWLQYESWREKPFDLIILDPPTMSRSKKMTTSFDIQRDHYALLKQTRRLLAPKGVLMFSTNYRRFRPDPDAFDGFQSAEEITAQSVPEDFPRSKPHRAWWLVNG